MDSEALLKQRIEQLEIVVKKKEEIDQFTLEQLQRQEEEKLREDALSMDRKQFEKAGKKEPALQDGQDPFNKPEQELDTKEDKKKAEKKAKEREEIKEYSISFSMSAKKDETKNEVDSYRDELMDKEFEEQYGGNPQEVKEAIEENKQRAILLSSELQRLRNELSDSKLDEQKRKTIGDRIETIEQSLEELEKEQNAWNKVVSKDEGKREEKRKILNLTEKPKERTEHSDFQDRFMLLLIQEDPTIPIAGAESELASIEISLEDFDPDNVLDNFGPLQQKLKRIKVLCELFEEGSDNYNFLTGSNKGLVKTYKELLPLVEPYFDALMLSKGFKKTDNKYEKDPKIADFQRYLQMAKGKYSEIKNAFSHKHELMAENMEQQLVEINESTRMSGTNKAFEGQGKVIQSTPMVTMSQFEKLKSLQDLVGSKIDSVRGEAKKKLVKDLFQTAVNTMSAMTAMIKKLDALDGFRAKFAGVYLALLNERFTKSESKDEQAKIEKQMVDFSELNTALATDEVARLQDEAKLLEEDKKLKKEEKKKAEEELKKKYASYLEQKETADKEKLAGELRELLSKTGRKIDDKGKEFDSQMKEIIDKMPEEEKKANEQEIAEAKKAEKEPPYLDAKKQMGLSAQGGEGAESTLFGFGDKVKGDAQEAMKMIAPYEDSIKAVFDLMKVRKEQYEKIKNRFEMLVKGIKFVLNDGLEGESAPKDKTAVLLMLVKDFGYKVDEKEIEGKLIQTKSLDFKGAQSFDAMVNSKIPSLKTNRYANEDKLEKLKPIYDLIQGKKDDLFGEILDGYEKVEKEANPNNKKAIRVNTIKKLVELSLWLAKEIVQYEVPDKVETLTKEEKIKLYKYSEYVIAFEHMQNIIRTDEFAVVGYNESQGKELEKEKVYEKRILMAKRRDRYNALIEAYEAGIDITLYIDDAEKLRIAKVNKCKPSKLDKEMIYKYCKKRLGIDTHNETTLAKVNVESGEETQKQEYGAEYDKNEAHKGFWEEWKTVCKEYNLAFDDGKVTDVVSLESSIATCKEMLKTEKENKAKSESKMKDSSMVFTFDDAAEDAKIEHNIYKLNRQLVLLESAKKLWAGAKKEEKGDAKEPKIEPVIDNIVALCSREGMKDVSGKEIRQMFWEITGIVEVSELVDADPKQSEAKENGMKKYKEKMIVFYENVEKTFGVTMPALEILLANSVLINQILAGLKLDRMVVGDSKVTDTNDEKDKLLSFRVAYFGAMAEMFQLIKDKLGTGSDMEDIRASAEYSDLKQKMKDAKLALESVGMGLIEG